MQSDDPIWWPAHRVAAAIAARTMSAREYLDELLARVDRYNDRLNLVVTIDERARDRAREADEAVVRGEPLGPLHGVPMTVKDCLATAGLTTTGGMEQLARYVPRADAGSVAALRRAGANIFGKTNLPAGSADLQSYNDLFGVARNPWNPAYTTGGSSGGACGAVAAGFTPLELGSDVAGSIRVPAAFCGVLGHKPSFGLVPMTGHVPPFPYRVTPPDLAVIGPIARCVEDLELTLGVLAGPHPMDRPGWQVSLPPARPIRRVAIWSDDPYCPVDREVREAVEAAGARLAAAGVTVEPARPSGIRLAASDKVFRRLLAGAGSRAGATGAQFAAEFVEQSYQEWLDADDRRARLREYWKQFFAQYDALLLPVAPNVTIPHDLRPFAERQVLIDGVARPYWDQLVWAGLTGVGHLPSTVVPVGHDSRGLPIGVAVASDYLLDRTALAAARMLAGVSEPPGHPDLDLMLTAGGVAR
ncbi:amidase [Actinoplanes cyaneus]|uniref:Amidase n=1 Tax=Actinoplanes cyaneus TaxID=52696 RepID=A0A919M1H3_9ACTN|nr:amidase family protein [Actinoplanes cyaneus]MCW2138242.1 amidase [Actinoplanes cyaneus]GID66200.1 amidase [Actinoplanes cyaneus]